MEQIIMIVLMVAIFYFLLIRPENKRKKAADQMRSALKKGDKIVTIGGIMGTIVRVTEESIVIETSDDRVRMELTKWAVSTTGVQSSDTQTSKKKDEEKKDEVKETEEIPEKPADEPAAPAEEEKKD